MRRPIGRIYVNGTEVETFIFYGGEDHVRLPHMKARWAQIKAYLYSADDIMCLFLTVDALRQINPTIVIDLTIPYLPYARQDRVCSAGEAWSLRVMVDLIGKLGVNKLSIIDPHSHIAHRLFLEEGKDVEVVSLIDIFKDYQEVIKPERFTLIAPDEGAARKVSDLASHYELPVLYCKKARDLSTGAITSMEVPDSVEPGVNYLIVDDICDGGRTFITLAEKFARKGVTRENLYLYVTHGIFSKGTMLLRDNFIQIYCYHKFPNVETSTFLAVLDPQNKDVDFFSRIRPTK